MRLPRRKGPAEPVHAVRRTGQPDPSFNYELFNCNNFNIRYWSWNYRGCWPIRILIRCENVTAEAIRPSVMTRSIRLCGNYDASTIMSYSPKSALFVRGRYRYGGNSTYLK